MEDGRVGTSSKVICVLGMHRSGTSCLTGLLEDAGVYLGGVSKQNPHNRKGNQENLLIMRLHDEVLKDNGGGWDNPPHGDAAWSDAQTAALSAILEQYAGHPLWAFKDPRSLFTLSAWQQALPQLAHIGTFRHPGAVAQSLHRRGKMSAEQGFALWLRYNARLLELQTRYGFDLLCFDLEPEGYMRAVGKAFQRLGLDASHTTLAFFEESLRNTAIDPMFATPPPETMRVYERMREMAA
jgi:hypothetical protein